MKKDIYVIKNRINDKVYIGQSKNAYHRFIQHCKPSSAKENSLISKAIQKFGAENFWVEIIESQVENYNEREVYWIKQFDCIIPNGYNTLPGGEEPPTYYSVKSPNSRFESEDDVNSIKNDLRNSSLSLNELAEKYGVSKKSVLRINQGITHAKLNEKYPIRQTPNRNGKLTDSDVEDIIEILRYSYRQYEDIASQYGISISAVKQINTGDCHPLKGVKYPIREYKNSGIPACTYEQVTEISELLLKTSISCRQLAKCFGVDLQTIYTINNGNAKRYRREKYRYPLRKHNPIS